MTELYRAPKCEDQSACTKSKTKRKNLEHLPAKIQNNDDQVQQGHCKKSTKQQDSYEGYLAPNCGDYPPPHYSGITTFAEPVAGLEIHLHMRRMMQ